MSPPVFPAPGLRPEPEPASDELDPIDAAHGELPPQSRGLDSHPLVVWPSDRTRAQRLRIAKAAFTAGMWATLIAVIVGVWALGQGIYWMSFVPFVSLSAAGLFLLITERLARAEGLSHEMSIRPQRIDDLIGSLRAWTSHDDTELVATTTRSGLDRTLSSLESNRETWVSEAISAARFSEAISYGTDMLDVARNELDTLADELDQPFEALRG